MWSYIENEIWIMPLNTLDDVKKAVADAWKNMDVKFIQNCIESMPKRLQAVKLAKGGNTKY